MPLGLTKLIVSPCPKDFGGWYRASNIARRLGVPFVFPLTHRNVFHRLLRGLGNLSYLGKFDVFYLFELNQPETFFLAVFGKVLGKRVLVDIGDEWLWSPTYLEGGLWIRLWIRFCDWLVGFFDITVTSDYLQRKYKKGIKIINYVDSSEFDPIPREEARRVLGYSPGDKVVLSFGNTWGNLRTKLRNETSNWIKHYDKGIRLEAVTGLAKDRLALYLGACDLVLFPTGDTPCERACFPIRVGTCLNAGRVIATDDSPTEFHNTLRHYNCMIMGDRPQSIALGVIRFFNDNDYREKLEGNVLVAKQAFDWDKCGKILFLI